MSGGFNVLLMHACPRGRWQVQEGGRTQRGIVDDVAKAARVSMAAVGTATAMVGCHADADPHPALRVY